jgi:rhamnogalacturonan endolyase
MARVMICLPATLLVGTVQAKVSMTDSGNRITLSNDEVSLTLDKGKARVVELIHNGNSLLVPRETGYFTLIAAEAGDSQTQKKNLIFRIKDCQVTPRLQTADTIDLSFVPERSAGFPLDIEIHYVLRQGQQGYYFYIVAGKDADTPDAKIIQFRYAMRMDHSMLNIRLNDERFGVLPSTESIRNAQGMVMDATYLLASGEIVTKYQWSSPTDEAPVYGLNNGKQGIWMIRGGNESLCGGPTKQHNTCHATTDGPIALNLLYSNHYGSRGSYISGKWSKVFGPTFVYLNQASQPDALWEDAKQQAESLRNSWPYSWMAQPGYPIKRATVSGRFAGVDQGWVILARPKEFRGLDWQKQGGDAYIYRARIKADGSFTLSAVRKGTYSLYAFVPGRVGEFRKDNVAVDSTDTIRLGDLSWAPRSFGKLLWRIGTPDRTAAEFKHGDNFRHWGLWFNYRNDFLNDVDFTLGQSQERTDWNYAQMAVWEESGGWKPKLDAKVGEGKWELPAWKIRFYHDKSIQGSATLTLALAGVNRDGSLAVALNGEPLEIFDGLTGDSSIHRSGIYGNFRERFLTFDASLLHQEENVIILEIRPATRLKSRANYSPFGVMYDFVQLEVDEAGGE